jgi:hypothetical protein
LAAQTGFQVRRGDPPVTQNELARACLEKTSEHMRVLEVLM